MSDPLRDDFLPSLLDRSLAGECSGDEVARLHAWIAAHPDHAAQLVELRAIREVVAHRPLWNVSQMWEGVVRKLAHVEPSWKAAEGQHSTAEGVEIPMRSKSHATPTVQRRRFVESAPSRGGRGTFKAQLLLRNVWYALAGAVVATIVLFGGQHLGSKPWGTNRHVVMSTYTTGNGERANITLPDGGTVALNVASRLDVPADYLSGNHTVRLAGEALFTVRHHEGAPLTVLAGRTITRVLGTTFLVRHYAADSSTTVAVQDGRVAVHTDRGHSMVLVPAQQLVVDRRGGIDARRADRSLFNFAAGVLSLARVPLPLAIVELDRWYDADIRLADPALRARSFTGDCAAGSLADLTEILQATYNVRVVREGRVLTLFSR